MACGYEASVRTDNRRTKCSCSTVTLGLRSFVVNAPDRQLITVPCPNGPFASRHPTYLMTWFRLREMLSSDTLLSPTLTAKHKEMNSSPGHCSGANGALFSGNGHGVHKAGNFGQPWLLHRTRYL